MIESEVLSMLRDGTLQGKTIVMGDSRDRMAKMAAEVPNSAVLISQHANGYTQQMERVRETIVREGVLGPKVDVLFATTTMREGVTLRPESGVRNVVTFLPDELHVSQFLGRCRFDVENLVVVYAKSVVGRSGEVPYIVPSARTSRTLLSSGILAGFRACSTWCVVDCAMCSGTIGTAACGDLTST